MKWKTALSEDEKLELQNVMLLEPMLVKQIISIDAFNRLAAYGLVRFDGRSAVVIWERLKRGPIPGTR